MTLTTTFVSELLEVPENSLPRTEEHLRSAVTAEQIRTVLCVRSASEDNSSVHHLALKSWVVSKLHGVTWPTKDEVAKDFRDVLADGIGTLERIGDIIRLERGYYTALPPMAVMLDDDSALFLCGSPMRCFPQLIDHVRFGSIGRTLTGVDRGMLEESGITIITIEHYTGRDDRDLKAEEYLESRFIEGNPEQWEGRPRTQYYSGPIDQWPPYGRYGFGDLRTHATVKHAWFDLLRVRESEDHYNGKYILTKQEGKDIIAVEIEDWKRVALALDKVQGRERRVVARREGEMVRIGIPCSLPRPEFRLLHAAGADYLGWGDNAVQYNVPASSLSTMKTALERCWFVVEEA